MADEHETNDRKGVTRRQFMTRVGVGAVAATVVGGPPAGRAEAAQVMRPGEMAKITLWINTRRHRLLVAPRWSLLYVIRERLGLTATKVGCERGECGACTVLVDDRPIYACMLLAVEAENKKITTLEGLMQGEQIGPVQDAFIQHDAFQCGYCTCGQIMAAEGLLRKNPRPADEAIPLAVSGNLCRCGAYPQIFKAVRAAADKRGDQ